jgi:hypothetical protein
MNYSFHSSPARPLILGLLFINLTTSLPAAVFHVTPDGNDRNSGSAERPLASLAGARDAVRASGLLGREPIQVIFRAGVYYLPEAVVFTAADSGAAIAPVLYQAARGAEVVINGGKKLALQWQPQANGIFSARVPEGLEMDQLFVNGVLQRMARYPNHDPEVAIFNGYAPDAFSPARAAGWADPTGGYMHAIHGNRWGSYHYLITANNPDGSLRFEGGWQTGGSTIHPQYRFVENIREELDAPGEWFHDRKAGLLLFYPPAGTDLNRATIEYASLRTLVELRGTREALVRFVRFSGLTFRHAKRTFMDTRERMLGSDWRIYRGGAVYFEGAEDCGLDRCTLEQLGGNAVFVNNYNRRITVQTCRIEDCGASGVAFVGNPAAAREPNRKGRSEGGRENFDFKPGPLTDDYPAECRVENSLICRLGLVEKQVAGVEISMARRITVRDCSIYEMPRAGIDIGNGCWGGHLIEGCDVFDTVLETGDHGSFNSWGRDRLMDRNLAENERAETALLDNMEPTVIRNSRWRCDHGWDIDLDDGSSNYLIYNNLMLNGGLKVRQGFRRHAWNNVIVNDALHPHVWYPDSGDTFTRNIVMGPYRPARMGEGKWGRELDHNFFTSGEADRTAYAQYGVDVHSVVGDAKFIDPVSGDFRVADDSPALALGFHNFPMDTFGVRDLQLRAQARTPDIPRLRSASGTVHSVVYDWLGGQIRQLEGGEYSAWGISSEAGGVLVLFAPGYGPIGEAGLRRGDLIYSCGSVQVKNVEDLARCIEGAPADQPLTLLIRREGGAGNKVVFPSRPALPKQP